MSDVDSPDLFDSCSSDSSDDSDSEDLSIADSDISDVEDEIHAVQVLQPLESEWSSELEPIETPPFICEVGPSHNLRRSDNEKTFFELIFDERCVRVLTEGTNRYSRESQEQKGSLYNSIHT